MATLKTSINFSPQTSAIIVPHKPDPLTISYPQLLSDVLSFQKRLAALGITPQAAVSISLPNSYEFVVAFLAASWQRAIAAPLNPAYKQDEFEFYIDDLSSAIVLVPRNTFAQGGSIIRAAQKYFVAIAECYWDGREIVLDLKDAGRLRGLQPLQEPKSEDVALVLHTSGTTGRPKAVPLTHRNLIKTMENIQNTYLLTPTDRTLLVMPLFHVHGLLAGLLAPLISGGSAIIPLRFSASEFWELFITNRANWYTAVPSIHQILLRNPSPATLPNIRFIRSCSSPLSPKVFHELEKTFNAPVLEAYAMTEAAHQMTSNPLPPAKRYPGSVGIGQGVEVKILDQAGAEVARGSEGEICVRGANVTKGYLNNTEANRTSFTNDRFFRTGDQGKQDKEGYITITGRIKELINKGGEKISPVEIDNVVTQHPSVGEAVSFAVPDEIYGQAIGLAIVLKDGAKLTEHDLRNWMSTKVAKFKLPKKIYIVDVMPKTATGKIQRRMIAAAMLERHKPKAKL
ncbi:hypothetical protein MMC07_009760 [Pseudocyphellaria aurata]|nr:hypothetical protein [Pseudocyphellaria aurata]